MNCPTCGNEVRGRFCTNCGTRMDQPAASAPPAYESTSTAAWHSHDLENLPSPQASVSQEPPPVAAEPAPPPAAAAETARLRAEDLQAYAAQQSTPPPPQNPPPAPRPPLQQWEQRPPPTQPAGGGRFGGFTGGGPGLGEPAMPNGPTFGPMTLGQVVSGTFAILQGRMLSFLSVAVAEAIAMFVGFFVFGLITVAAGLSGTGGLVLAAVLGGIVLALVGVVVGAVTAVAYINIARGTDGIEGSTDLVNDTIGLLRRSLREAPPLLLALLLLAGIVIAAEIVLVLVGFVLGPLAVILGLAAFVALIWIGVSLIFVPQMAVIDRASPTAAIRGSMDLVSGHWWRTFGYLVVAWLIGVGIYIAGLIVIAIISIITSHIPILGAFVNALLYGALSAVFTAFYITYGTLMFFDLRARKAGTAQQAAPVASY